MSTISPEQLGALSPCMEELFNDYESGDAQEALWRMFELAVSAQDFENLGSAQRREFTSFFHRINRMLRKAEEIYFK